MPEGLKISMEQIYRIIGQLHIELEVLREMNKRLLERVQEKEVSNLSAPQNPDPPQ